MVNPGLIKWLQRSKALSGDNLRIWPLRTHLCTDMQPDATNLTSLYRNSLQTNDFFKGQGIGKKNKHC